MPGFGIRYFVPDYINAAQNRKEEKLRQEDAKNNNIETNEVNDADGDYGADRLWKHEKEAAKRVVRTSQEVGDLTILNYFVENELLKVYTKF